MRGFRSLRITFLRATLVIALLVVAAGLSVVVGLGVGSTAQPLWSALSGADPAAHEVLFSLRLPRALAAFGVGALLALAGALMQALLRNPLADPYVLGVSGGAATLALCAMLAGLPIAGVQAAAFAGALGSTLLVFALAHSRHDLAPSRLLLTGVVLASGWGAAVSLILSLAPEARLRGMVFWLLGDFAGTETPWPALIAAALILAVCLFEARALNLLARGELRAASLGVDVRRLRWKVYVIASAAAAVAVTTAGSVGFVGLVTPHLLRLIGLRDYRLLLPASVLAGGALLTVADALARSIIAPQQLPVGVITALIGVPLFLFLLRRETA
ncbi:MAG: iron ABC transporter permease [Sterolibacteriaceae bacterium]|jgi:iron complex transport system permease protein|nr:iron ABC transporter permease [Sterolibacteriaceae bacterium]MBK9087140.1 iron ABC transporter permease [Sterolibacteriaceae bacterium]